MAEAVGFEPTRQAQHPAFQISSLLPYDHLGTPPFCCVGVKGFEPSTSWTQTKHSNRTELHPVKYPQHSNKYGSERRPIFALSVVALVLIIQTSSFLHQVLVDICEPSEARTPDPSLKVMRSTY